MPGIIMAFKTYRLQRPPADSWIQNRFIYSLIQSPWVGLKNFEYLVLPTNMNATLTYIRNTVLYNLLFMVVGLVLAVALAVIIFELTNRYEEADHLADAIVVIENIHRCEGLGMAPPKAAAIGSRQVPLAVVGACAAMSNSVTWSVSGTRCVRSTDSRSASTGCRRSWRRRPVSTLDSCSRSTRRRRSSP